MSLKKCNAGHDLKYVNQCPYKESYGVDFAVCNECQKEIYPSFLHCSKCEEDYCLDCANKRE